MKFENGFATESGKITVYNVDANNIYTHESTEWVSQGTGLPANCYIEKPLNPRKGYVVQRIEDKWQYVENHIGETVWSKADQSELTVSVYGSIPDTHTTLQPPSSAYDFDNKSNQWVLNGERSKEHLSELQERIWTAIKDYRLQRSYKGIHIKSVDKWFETGEEEKIKILGLLAMVNRMNLPHDVHIPGFDWTTMDNSTVPISQDLLVELLTEMARAENADHLVSWEHREEMLKSSDPEHYDFSTHWVKRYNDPLEPTPVVYASETTIKV